MPEALRRDVRLLTTLLGDAIRDHDGPERFTQVEALRRAVIGLHERPTPSRAAAVDRLIGALDPGAALRVARAFTAFFQLVNVAEDRQRVRDLRAGEHETPAPVPRPIELTEVLTAHPTEAKRRAVVEHLWRIGDLLDGPGRPACGRARALGHPPSAPRGDRRAVAHRSRPSCTRPPPSTRCARCSPCSTARSSRRCPGSADARGHVRRSDGRPGWAETATATLASPPRSPATRWASSASTCSAATRPPPGGSPARSRCPSPTSSPRRRCGVRSRRTRRTSRGGRPSWRARCPTRPTAAS